MIGIITSNTDTFSNPTLYALMKLLNSKGIAVGLFSAHNDNSIPPELPLTHHYQAPAGAIIPRRPRPLLNYLRSFFRSLRIVRNSRIKHLIAVDQSGLILAGRIKRFIPDIRIHYFSFEIFFRSEIGRSPGLMLLKKKELQYTRLIQSLVIQDKIRLKLLIEENQISENQCPFFLIPVAPMAQPVKDTGMYDRKDLGFKDKDTIYVHSGSVANWAGIDLIIECLEQGLPDDTYILIHNRRKFDPGIPQHARLLQLEKQGAPVRLHDHIFDSYDEYCSFLSCFDYGLAIYKDDGGEYTGLNIKHIGLASGKLSTYMSLGMPVLLNECQTYTEITDTYHIGAIVTPDRDLNFQIRSGILKTVSKKSCFSFYDAVLNPETELTKFIKSLD